MYNVIAQDIISQVGMVSLQRPTEDHTSRAESYNPTPRIQTADMPKQLSHNGKVYSIIIPYNYLLFYYIILL